jgi:tryptophanyl-tRNA synthetase
MRVLSGIQPSGVMHIGNYFGAVKPIISSQDSGELFAFIASYHAMTSVKDKDILKQNTFDTAVNFLSLGLDPDQATFYRQHDVPQVAELYWILSTLTPMAMLERGHSYKDKIAKGIKSSHGLFSYPVLMAADILLYDANIVPVGKDQIQHIEMCRDIATTFNDRFGDVLTIPNIKIEQNTQTVLGTDGAKMSKSYNNTIDIFGHDKQLKKQIMSITTDSKGLNEPKDYQSCNIYKLCELFMSEGELAQLQQRYKSADEGYGHFKHTLLQTIQEYFQKFKIKREYYLKNPDEVEDILLQGAKKASIIASAKIEIVRQAVGLS